MNLFILVFFLVIGLLVYDVGLNRGASVSTVVVEGRSPDLKAIFANGNYQQCIDQFGTVSRTAFDGSGQRIGTQVGNYLRGAPYGMLVEVTYLVPDADHPFGQAFDGAGNPMPLDTGPEQSTPVDRS